MWVRNERNEPTSWGEQPSRSGVHLQGVQRGAGALEPAQIWCWRTPRAVVLACGPHVAASHRAHPTEAPARSTARAHFERTEIGSICAHMGPEDGDNSNTRANVAPFRSRANRPIRF